MFCALDAIKFIYLYLYVLCLCYAQLFSCVQFFVTPWTVARQAPLPMDFPRHEYWSGLPFLTPGDLPNPGIEVVSLASPAVAGGFFTTAVPGKHILHLPYPIFPFIIVYFMFRPLIYMNFAFLCKSPYLLVGG